MSSPSVRPQRLIAQPNPSEPVVLIDSSPHLVLHKLERFDAYSYHHDAGP